MTRTQFDLCCVVDTDHRVVVNKIFEMDPSRNSFYVFTENFVEKQRVERRVAQPFRLKKRLPDVRCRSFETLHRVDPVSYTDRRWALNRRRSFVIVLTVRRVIHVHY